MSKRVAVPEGKALFFRRPDSLPTEAGPALREAEAPAEKGQTRQSAIFLEERHLDWLEDRCREARRNGGRAIRKAAVIRAILDVAMSREINLTSLRREEDLVERVRRGVAAAGQQSQPSC